MAINLAAISNLLRPGLAAVFGNYQSYPQEWSEIYTKYTSDKQQEIEQEMKFTGLASIFGEGAPIPISDMRQNNQYVYVHKYAGLQTIITRQAIVDNLYETEFPMMAQSLKRSMMQLKEILGAQVLNNGFVTPIGDGQPFFSINHPIDNGVVANTFAVQADLNEASLESMINLIGKARDVAGLLTKVVAQKLIVPIELQFTASRLLNSQFRTGTPNNDINAIYFGDYMPKGYVVNHFLTNPASWYILTDAPNGMKYWEREAIETDVYTDFDNKNLKTSALERYSFGVSNFRAMYASSGAP